MSVDCSLHQMALGLLYSADSGGTVLVWRLDTLECIAELEVAFSRISSMLVGSGLIYCYGSRGKKACLEILSHVSFRLGVVSLIPVVNDYLTSS